MGPTTDKWDAVEDLDLGDGLGQRELFFWAERKRAENMQHIELGHTNRCSKCHNCLCAAFRWVCRCSAGKTQITPYRIRFKQDGDREPYRIRG